MRNDDGTFACGPISYSARAVGWVSLSPMKYNLRFSPSISFLLLTAIITNISLVKILTWSWLNVCDLFNDEGRIDSYRTLNTSLLLSFICDCTMWINPTYMFHKNSRRHKSKKNKTKTDCRRCLYTLPLTTDPENCYSHCRADQSWSWWRLLFIRSDLTN